MRFVEGLWSEEDGWVFLMAGLPGRRGDIPDYAALARALSETRCLLNWGNSSAVDYVPYKATALRAHSNVIGWTR